MVLCAISSLYPPTDNLLHVLQKTYITWHISNSYTLVATHQQTDLPIWIFTDEDQRDYERTRCRLEGGE
jgi:hypothetical protein